MVWIFKWVGLTVLYDIVREVTTEKWTSYKMYWERDKTETLTANWNTDFLNKIHRDWGVLTTCLEWKAISDILIKEGKYYRASKKSDLFWEGSKCVDNSLTCKFSIRIKNARFTFL